MPKLIDVTGQRFGRLTVLERAENHTTPNGTKVTMWRCKCDCGNEVMVGTQKLRNGECKSCGCHHKEVLQQMNFQDLTGQRFGKLTAIKVHSRGNGIVKWLCKCDCGNMSVVRSGNLKKNHTRSCGCLSNESRILVHTKHGHRKKKIYGIWSKMKSRCYDKNNNSYHRYGGLGITVCDEWRDSPDSFIKWAYESGYDENAQYGQCTLDRVDNSKGYSPDNCRWADSRTQANNRRSNRIIEHNGQRHTLIEWARLLGVSNSKLIWHLDRGRTIQDVIDNYLG